MVYAASKAAVAMLTLKYAQALPGVKVNAAFPGLTATDLTAGFPGGQPVQDAVDVIVRLATLGPDGPTGTVQECSVRSPAACGSPKPAGPSQQTGRGPPHRATQRPRPRARPARTLARSAARLVPLRPPDASRGGRPCTTAAPLEQFFTRRRKPVDTEMTPIPSVARATAAGPPCNLSRQPQVAGTPSRSGLPWA